jgi:hypothetical protein
VLSTRAVSTSCPNSTRTVSFTASSRAGAADCDVTLTILGRPLPQSDEPVLATGIIAFSSHGRSAPVGFWSVTTPALQLTFRLYAARSANPAPAGLTTVIVNWSKMLVGLVHAPV